MINQDDLVDFNGIPTLVLRFKNCTGNIIVLDKKIIQVDQLEQDESYIALTIDTQFKNQRHRTVEQMADMVLRWRKIASGYYDYQISRYVKPISLGQAAKNLALRHQMLTGEDQHINVKTLDDYVNKIKLGADAKNPYNFGENKDALVACLRKHCLETRTME